MKRTITFNIQNPTDGSRKEDIYFMQMLILDPSHNKLDWDAKIESGGILSDMVTHLSKNNHINRAEIALPRDSSRFTEVKIIVDIPTSASYGKYMIEMEIVPLTNNKRYLMDHMKKVTIPFDIISKDEKAKRGLGDEEKEIISASAKESQVMQQDLLKIEELMQLLQNVESALKQAHDNRARYAFAIQMKEAPEMLKIPDIKFNDLEKALRSQVKKLIDMEKDLESESKTVEVLENMGTPSTKLMVDELSHKILNRNVKLRQSILNLQQVIGEKDKQGILNQADSSLKAIKAIFRSPTKAQNEIKTGGSNIVHIFDTLIYYLHSIRDKLVNAKEMFTYVQQYSAQTKQMIDRIEKEITKPDIKAA
ncbi:hypothetical protein H6503_06280 [Candidatus Woesearchaeota archaeon]|nr:hypothetical protein [Candidatus Woesearchaeota archaeon]